MLLAAVYHFGRVFITKNWLSPDESGFLSYDLMQVGRFASLRCKTGK
jgi:hypothetical protein